MSVMFWIISTHINCILLKVGPRGNCKRGWHGVIFMLYRLSPLACSSSELVSESINLFTQFVELLMQGISPLRALYIILNWRLNFDSFIKEITSNYLMWTFFSHHGSPYRKLCGQLFPKFCFEVSFKLGKNGPIKRKRKMKHCHVLYTYLLQKYFDRFIKSSRDFKS